MIPTNQYSVYPALAFMTAWSRRGMLLTSDYRNTSSNASHASITASTCCGVAIPKVDDEQYDQLEQLYIGSHRLAWL